MKILVGLKTLWERRYHTPGRYEGISFVEGIYKDHRRIKREKRRAKKGIS